MFSKEHQMKNIGVILAGCGYLDGAEIRESVLTLLCIDECGANAEIFAPNINQHHVVNHLNGEEKNEARNVLEESARIARGKIKDLESLEINKLDALILPGGFGVAKNLSNLAFNGPEGEINETLSQILTTALEQKKPIGAICISPAVICLGIGKASPEVTIGNDEGTAGAIKALGGIHQNKTVKEIQIDMKNKIVTTPAYMYDDASISDVAAGISQCVKKVIELS